MTELSAAIIAAYKQTIVLNLNAIDELSIPTGSVSLTYDADDQQWAGASAGYDWTVSLPNASGVMTIEAYDDDARVAHGTVDAWGAVELVLD